MENLTEYLSVEIAIIVPSLWIIGFFLKSTPKVENWLIVWILLLLGVTGAVSIIGFNPEGVSQGVIASGIAVLGHQILKQTKEK